MGWFRNMKMAGKLGLGFGLLAALTVTIGILSFLGMNKMMARATQANREAIAATNLLRAEQALTLVRIEIVYSALDATPEAVDKRIAKIKDQDVVFYDQFDRFQKSLTDETSRQKASETLQKYKEVRGEQDAIVLLARAMRKQEAVAGFATIREKALAVITNLQELREASLTRVDRAQKEQAADFVRTRGLLLTVLVTALALAALVSWFITQLIGSSLTRVMGVTQQAATGDLTVRVQIDSKDELGETGASLNRFLESLHESMSQVAQSSQAVASASSQLSSGAEQIASGAQEQASSLEETAASLEEITSTVKQNADNAQQANQLASGSREVAEKGGRVVGTAVEAMAEINRSSKKIADIITTIDEIAFQTNLLALNAAVEAARAGEQGRGFAVVAAEVRNLAQRSATAAKEIKVLIQDSVHKVEGGTELVNQSGQTLNEIVASVKRVTDIVGEIAAASREQSTGIDQVNKAVTQMDQVTQSNASQTEELNATAENLAGQAQQLQALVAQFKLTRGSEAAGPPAVRTEGGRAPARHPAPRATKPAPAAEGHPAAHGGGWEKGFEEF